MDQREVKEKRKLRVRWIVYLWVFDDQAHRRCLCASLPGGLLVSQVRNTASFKALRWWFWCSFPPKKRRTLSSCIRPLFSVLFTLNWSHFSFMFLLWAAIKWSPLHPMVSVPLSIVFSVTPPFHSPCKLFAAHIHHFFPFSIQFCPDTLTFYPFSVLPNLHLCSPLTIALSSTFLSYISHSWFFSFLPTSSFSSFNLSAHRTQWLNVSQKHTLHVLSPHCHPFLCTSHNPPSVLSTFSLTSLTITLLVLSQCTPLRSPGTPLSSSGSMAPRQTSPWVDVGMTMRRKEINTPSSQMPGWSPSSSPSSCWSDWWEILWLFMSFPNTGRWGRQPTST